MNSFNRDNLNHIKHIFENRAGVELTERKAILRPIRTVAVLVAAIACCLSLTAFAINLFSSLSGDDLGLHATYDGNGVVSIMVENRSDKELNFQSVLKLMLWSTGEEIQPTSDTIVFDGTKIKAHASGTMTIDLSNAYDIEMLEEPLTDDSYYFILTNNNFVFGQDWTCTVKFAETIITPTEDIPPVQADEAILQEVAESLQYYFETITFDLEERHALNAEYMKAYAELFEQFDGNIVPSVSPFTLLVGDAPSGIIFDSSVSTEQQYLLVGEHWSSSDTNFNLLATDTETALTISALLPFTKYTDVDTGTYLPLFYIFMYEKDTIENESDYAFIYGQIISFSDLEKYKVYEDEQYVCYEASELIYSDLTEHIQSFVSQNPNVRYDEQVQMRVENIHSYFKENLSELFFTR